MIYLSVYLLIYLSLGTAGHPGVLRVDADGRVQVQPHQGLGGSSGMHNLTIIYWDHVN